MKELANPGVTVAEVIKALSDPIRWDIVQQVGAVEELPCVALEDTLPISKPTISYHTKILVQARLIKVTKRGRNSFYTLNRDVVSALVEELWNLAPGPRPVKDGKVDYQSPTRSRRARRDSEPRDNETANELVVLTW